MSIKRRIRKQAGGRQKKEKTEVPLTSGTNETTGLRGPIGEVDIEMKIWRSVRDKNILSLAKSSHQPHKELVKKARDGNLLAEEVLGDIWGCQEDWRQC